MSKPNNLKKNLIFNKGRQNYEYPQSGYMESGGAENMKDLIIDKDNYLPKGVLHIDLDNGFKDFINNKAKLTLNGEKVPVMMMGIQKWSEFAKNWEHLDEYKNVKIPFISIVRNPDTQPGTNPSLIYNIPQGKCFFYAEVPTWDGNTKGVDLYKIPQPVPIDITYEVRIYAFRQQDLNFFNTIIMKLFQSRQAYTIVNGHHIPIILDSTSDESQLNALDVKRYYVQLYSFQLQGFILDPNDFEVTPAINRTLIATEIETKFD